MRSLNLPPEKECLRDHRQDHRGSDWSSLPQPCRIETLEQSIANQENLCGYCERTITTKNSHLDHIRPKGRAEFMQLTFETSNLLASCGKTSGQTCGHAKGGKVLPDWLHPYEHRDLASLFRIREDGYLIARSDAPEDAQSAVDDILRLNERTLKSARQRHIAQLNSFKNQPDLNPTDIASFFQEFPSITNTILGLYQTA